MWASFKSAFSHTGREIVRSTNTRNPTRSLMENETVYQVTRIGPFATDRAEIANIKFSVDGDKAYGALFEVSSEFQGEGEGRRQLLELENRLCDRGVKSIEGHAYEAKVGFYTACGFVEDLHRPAYVKRTFECATIKQRYADMMAAASTA